MKNTIELYINNQKVDLSDSTKVLFTYRIKDVYNPVGVKNSFTKTVTLEGTPNNNQIFNHLYNLDVAYTIDNVKSFNSSKRNPFELYNNGELIESGYMKLDSIKRTGNLVNYNCTLYGGLGDFFYNLMYDVDGNKRTLASLDYLEGGDDEFDFEINRNTVKEAWDKLNPTRTRGGGTVVTPSKWHYINFMPAYNGIGDTMDCEHILVNTNGFSSPMRKWDGESNKWVDINGFPTQLDNDFKLKNGYAFVELAKPMSEWQMRDLRSYMQRPVVSMKGIIQAITKPENNGGYEVILDNDFFNENNPYYQNSWVTLPLLNDLEYKENTVQTTPTATIGNHYRLSVNSSYWEYEIQLSDTVPAGVSEMNFEMDLKALQSGTTVTNNSLYFCTNITNNSTPTGYDERYRGKQYQGMYLQVLAYDGNGNRVAGSNKVWLTSELSSGDYYKPSDAYVTNEYGSVDTQIGTWDRISGTDYWKWSGRLKFKMDISNVIVNEFRIGFGMKLEANGTRLAQRSLNLFGSKSFTYNSSTWGSNCGTFYVGVPSLDSNFYNKECILQSGGEDLGVFSNSPINKKMLLTTDNTPADYLLSFGKLFNLYYEKDPFEKKIYVRVMKNYYDGKSINLEDMVDRSKEMNITPLAFDTNTYEMSYKSDDKSETEEKYEGLYGAEFGSQRINTGYDFDAEKKQLYDGIFTNAAQTIESSRFYTHCYSEGKEVPTFLYANVTYKLFNSSGETSDCTLTRPKNTRENPINKNSVEDGQLTAPYYDIFDKVQFHNNNEPITGKDVLVFFNGFLSAYKSPNSTRSSVGAYYTLSDDLQEMIVFNEKPCYLYSQSEKSAAGQDICLRISSLPQFSRYITRSRYNEINYTMDFGRTKALYIPNMKYVNGDTTIYERYWKAYIEDLYDIDTRLVECYVRFDEKVVQNYLKHYYYFDGCYWVLLEIVDYDPTSTGTFKCKFVKVNEFGVYTEYNPAEFPEGIAVLTIEPSIVGTATTAVTCYLWVDGNTPWTIDSYSSGLTPSVTAGTGSTTFTVQVPENTGDTELQYTITIKSLTNYVTGNITQLGPYSDTTFTVTQFAQFSNGNVWAQSGTCLYTVRSSYPWTVTSDRTYCTPLSSGGTGDTQYGQTLEVHWDANDTYSSRQAILTFTNALGQVIHMIKAQDGISDDQYYTYNYDVSGGTYTVAVMTTGATIETKPNWITITNNGDGTYSLVADENTGTERSGLVVFSPAENVSVTVQVSQNSAGSIVGGFNVTPSSISFSSGGGYQYITITNPDNNNWRITSPSEWYGFNTTQGSSSTQTISCMAEANTGSTRTSSIEFTNVNTGNKYYVSVIQYASGTTPSISINPNPLSVVATGETKQIVITYTNRDGDFLIATPSSTAVTVGNIVFNGETAVVDITVAGNTSLTPRTFTVSFVGATTSETLTINQGGNVTLEVNPQALTFTNTGGTATITITSNDGWTIE